MKIILQNFRCYKGKPSIHEFDEPSITLLKGKSGEGKSTLLSSIVWCLYGGLRGNSIKPIGNVSSKSSEGVSSSSTSSSSLSLDEFIKKHINDFGAGPSATVVILIFEDFVVRRKHAATSAMEVFLPSKSLTLKGDEASSWINSTFGNKTLWLSSSYISQNGRNPLLSLSNDEKFSLLYEVAFGNSSSSNNDSTVKNVPSSLAKGNPEEIIRRLTEAVVKARKKVAEASCQVAMARDYYDSCTKKYKEFCEGGGGKGCYENMSKDDDALATASEFKTSKHLLEEHEKLLKAADEYSNIEKEIIKRKETIKHLNSFRCNLEEKKISFIGNDGDYGDDDGRNKEESKTQKIFQERINLLKEERLKLEETFDKKRKELFTLETLLKNFQRLKENFLEFSNKEKEEFKTKTIFEIEELHKSTLEHILTVKSLVKYERDPLIVGRKFILDIFGLLGNDTETREHRIEFFDFLIDIKKCFDSKTPFEILEAVEKNVEIKNNALVQKLFKIKRNLEKRLISLKCSNSTKLTNERSVMMMHPGTILKLLKTHNLLSLDDDSHNSTKKSSSSSTMCSKCKRSDLIVSQAVDMLINDDSSSFSDTEIIASQLETILKRINETRNLEDRINKISSFGYDFSQFNGNDDDGNDDDDDVDENVVVDDVFKDLVKLESLFEMIDERKKEYSLEPYLKLKINLSELSLISSSKGELLEKASKLREEIKIKTYNYEKLKEKVKSFEFLKGEETIEEIYNHLTAQKKEFEDAIAFKRHFSKLKEDFENSSEALKNNIFLSTSSTIIENDNTPLSSSSLELSTKIKHKSLDHQTKKIKTEILKKNEQIEEVSKDFLKWKNIKERKETNRKEYEDVVNKISNIENEIEIENKKLSSLLYSSSSYSSSSDGNDNHITERIQKTKEQAREILQKLERVRFIENIEDASLRLEKAKKNEKEAIEYFEAGNQVAKRITEIIVKILKDVVSKLSLLVNKILEDIFDPFSQMVISFEIGNIELGQRVSTKTGVNTVSLNIFYKGVDYDSPNLLSGGELDRLSIALTMSLSLLTQSRLILLDECMSSLDESLREKCFDSFRKYLTGKTVINVCHEAVEGHHDNVNEI